MQAALDLAGVAYTGPGVAGGRLGHGQAGVRRGGSGGRAFPCSRGCCWTATAMATADGPTGSGSRAPTSSSPASAARRSASRWWPTSTRRAPGSDANAHLRAGAVVEPYREDLFDLNVAARTWPRPELSAVERPLRSTAAAEILGYADKYVGGEGMASAPRELPADLAPPLSCSTLHDAARTVLRLADVRGVARIDFLSDGRVTVRERGQHHPGITGALSVGRPAAPVHRPPRRA